MCCVNHGRCGRRATWAIQGGGDSRAYPYCRLHRAQFGRGSSFGHLVVLEEPLTRRPWREFFEVVEVAQPILES